MAATPSLVNACLLKWDALTAPLFPGGVRPAIYYAQAPATDSGGAQVQTTTTGYAVLRHRGSRTRAYAFGVTSRENHDVEFEIFYPSLGDCLTAALAARLNGGTTQQRLGFDYGALPDLVAPYRLLALRPAGDAAAMPGMGKTGAPVHSWLLRYRIELLEGR
jgi:hypothetical protein